MSSDVGPAIGIDLGTTYSCVAIWRRGAVEVLVNAQGNRTTPSYVAFTNTERLVGDGAFNQVALNPSNTVFDAKRLIGRKFNDETVKHDMAHWPFKVVSGKEDKPMILVRYRGEEKTLAAEEISSMVLSHMRMVAEENLGCAVKNVVITVPAYFNDAQRRATRDAGLIADLNVMRIVNEPTAAAIAYGLDNKKKGKKEIVLIFDFGGGTLDVSLLVVEDGVLEVKATAGDTHLGGEDFDNRLVDFFVGEFKKKHGGRDVTTSPKSMRRLRTACERAKRSLSTQSSSIISIDSLFQGIDYEGVITRAKFEYLTEDLFSRCTVPLFQCLMDGKVDKSTVDEVVLVGGSSRMPRIREKLGEFFGGKRNFKSSINPDEAVAHGAAIQAAMLTGDVDDIVLLDVTPLSLGLEIKGGAMNVIVPRNTPIPATKERAFTLARDNQTSTTYEVYEGERSMTRDNHLLGAFKLTGITPAPAYKPDILVKFHVDADGIMNISARDTSSGSQAELAITNEKRALTQKEIDRMVADAKAYKDEDETARKNVLSKNALEKYAYYVRNELNDVARTPPGCQRMRATVERAVTKALEWSDEKGYETDADEFDWKRMELENLWRPLKDKLHISD